MRVGVVCEGRTDFPAITEFFGAYLCELGVDAKFMPLFPQMDNTRSGGGWANVLIWLSKNPSNVRINKYFGGGIFGGDLATEPLDVILIHLDADVVEDNSFKKYVEKNYEFKFGPCLTAGDRGGIISTVLNMAADVDALSLADRRRHLVATAVESTETWCVAAYSPEQQDWESLRGNDLVNLFMKALEASESRVVQDVYQNVNKNYHRRNAFCKKHASNYDRIRNTCASFRTICDGFQDLL